MDLDASVDSPLGGQETARLIRFPASARYQTVAFDRKELTQILDLYGRRVADGDWRDYALDCGPETAIFSVFRRASEQPLYRITKTPALARKQGLYAVVAQGGLIVKRGADLPQVLRALLKKPELANA